MKKFILALLLSGTFCWIKAETSTIINIKDYPTCNNLNYPFTLGVPFKKGTLSSVENIKILDTEGKEIPVQTIKTSSWNTDKSVRWALLDFQLPPCKKIFLEYGGKVKKAKISGITINNITNGWVIDTGGAKFKVNAVKYNFIDQVDINGKKIFKSSDLTGPYLKNHEGEEFRAAWGKPDEVKLELAGPLRSVIKATGWFYSRKGDKFCRYIVRTHFFKGKKYVKVLYTFIITVPTAQAKFADIGLRIPFNVENVSLGSKSFNLKPNQSKYLLQYDSDMYLLGDGSNPVKWKETGDGKRSDGSIRAEDSNSSLIMQVGDFWQNFPNELEAVGGSSLIYHFWPAHGMAKPDRKIEDKDLQYLWFCHEGKTLNMGLNEQYKKAISERKNDPRFRYQKTGDKENCMGVAKTAELHIGFVIPKVKQRELVKIWNKAPVAMASPEWMCSSKVFGILHQLDIKRFPREEKLLSKMFDCERRLQDYTKDYGKFNFGDMHTKWDTERKRWDDGYRCWKAYHHGGARVPWLLYIRSGDPKYLRWAIRNTRHLIDVDTCNFATPEYMEKPYPNGKIPGALNDYKGLTHWHSGNRLRDYNCMTDFMLNYYFLTGDKRGLDVAELWGGSLLKRGQKMVQGREGAGVASALLDLYTATGKKEYFEYAKKLVEYICKFQNIDGDKTFSKHTVLYMNAKDFPVPIGTFTGGWENYAPFLERYYCITKDKKTAKSIVKWADAFCEGFGDTSSLFGTGDGLNILAYAWFISKNPKYLEYGKWELERFLKSQIHHKGYLYDGFVQVGQMSLAAGYMSQRLPVFMAAMADYGKEIKAKVPVSKVNKFPFVCYKEKERTYDILILNEKDKKISLSGMVACNGIILKPYINIYDPEGILIVNKEFPAEGSRKFDFKMENCPKGIFRIVFHGVKYVKLSTKPNLKRMYRCSSLRQRFGGTRFYFKIPENCSELGMQIKTTRNIRTDIQVDGPNGNIVKKISFAPFTDGKTYKTKIDIEKVNRGKLWSISGRFGKSNILKLSTAPEKFINWVSMAPDEWFDVSNYKYKENSKMKSSVKVISAVVMALALHSNSIKAAKVEKKPFRITINKDGEMFNSLIINTGKGAIQLSGKNGSSTYIWTKKGKSVNIFAPFFYSIGTKKFKTLVSDDKVCKELKVKMSNNGKSVVLKVSPPESDLSKEVVVTPVKNKNMLCFKNSTIALKSIKLVSDSQCTLFNGKELKLSVDGVAQAFENRKTIKKFNYVIVFNPANNITIGLVILESPDNYYRLKMRCGKNRSISLMWGNKGGRYEIGEKKEQKYILMWGDGNKTAEFKDIALKALIGKYSDYFPGNK